MGRPVYTLVIMLIKINLDFVKSAGITPADFIFLSELYEKTNYFTESYPTEHLVKAGWLNEVDGEIYLSPKFVEEFKEKDNLFYEFYDYFPSKDENGRPLRTNKDPAKKYYLRTIGKDVGFHKHILECLKYDVERRKRRGDLKFIQAIDNYVKNRAWEEIAIIMKEETLPPPIKNLW